jgi:ribosomal protein S18 acetylase RimI-like enzyme
VIRPARPDDVPVILRLVRDLAEYHRAHRDDVIATEEQISDALFGNDPAVFVHVAELEGAVVGLVVWWLSYSTWTGNHGIYLDELYVDPAARGRGFGKALLATLASICIDRGYTRLEWSVFDWNTPAIGFYESVGAVPMSDDTAHRLAGDGLAHLAATGLDAAAVVP